LAAPVAASTVVTNEASWPAEAAMSPVPWTTDDADGPPVAKS
jgi:hypothetical protein